MQTIVLSFNLALQAANKNIKIQDPDTKYLSRETNKQRQVQKATHDVDKSVSEIFCPLSEL